MDEAEGLTLRISVEMEERPNGLAFHIREIGATIYAKALGEERIGVTDAVEAFIDSFGADRKLIAQHLTSKGIEHRWETGTAEPAETSWTTGYILEHRHQFEDAPDREQNEERHEQADPATKDLDPEAKIAALGTSPEAVERKQYIIEETAQVNLAAVQEAIGSNSRTAQHSVTHPEIRKYIREAAERTNGLMMKSIGRNIGISSSTLWSEAEGIVPDEIRHYADEVVKAAVRGAGEAAMTATKQTIKLMTIGMKDGVTEAEMEVALNAATIAALEVFSKTAEGIIVTAKGCAKWLTRNGAGPGPQKLTAELVLGTMQGALGSAHQQMAKNRQILQATATQDETGEDPR